MKDQEALKASAVVSHLSDSLKDQVNNLLANGVVSPGVVVGSILLSGDQLLRVEHLTVDSTSDLKNNNSFFIFFMFFVDLEIITVTDCQRCKEI